MTTIMFELRKRNKEIEPGIMSSCRGTNPNGETYGFTNFYMTRNDVPIIPVVGEFHFSRFSYLYWEEELLKMKAGGVQMVATYVFWNFHEEEEGQFDWSGNRNLRHFIDLCAKHHFPVIVRIGPFCHGEVRNGGIPDWVFERPVQIRSNDEGYLVYVRRLYQEIARQLKGTFFRDGGPIIAVQLENEFMHCGAHFDAWGYATGAYISSGHDGRAHLGELRKVAEEVGIIPLFFTVTAWGGAVVPERDTLPMLAGYAYTPWIPNQPPSREYVFRDLHETPAEPVDYETGKYPVAYCEMAGGMQVSYNARPHVPAESIEAMTLVKLASGSNLLGYYMYHGGSNPTSRKGFLNEFSLPKISYDYQAPLGEFGRVAPSYDRIRLISLFLQTFGDLLAPMGTELPEGLTNMEPTDAENLRWCVRQKDGSGFLFLNNFQDHVDTKEQRFQMELVTAQGRVYFPRHGELTLQSGMCAILPFQLKLAGITVISATVQLLTKIECGEETVVLFFAHEGMEPEFVLRQSSIADVDPGEGRCEDDGENLVVSPAIGKGHSVVLKNVDGHTVHFVTLTRREALQTYRFQLWGQERVVISNSPLMVRTEQLLWNSQGSNQMILSIYPEVSDTLHAKQGRLSVSAQEGVFQRFECTLPVYEPSIHIDHRSDRSAIVDIDPAWPAQVEDVWLEVIYDGDVATAHVNHRLLTDHIHYGHPWHIGLKQVKHELEEGQLLLSITPIRRGTVHQFINQAFVERFEGVEIAKFHAIRAVVQYQVAICR